MSKLPEGWVETTLGAITHPITTIRPEAEPEKVFDYVDIGCIDNMALKIVDKKSYRGAEAPSRARRLIKEGDVLFSTVRTYLRNIATVTAELDGAITSTGITVLRANDAAEPRYIFAFVSSTDFSESISKSQDGTMYPAVADRDVFEHPIPLPPLAEQGRIVEKLDALSAQSRAAAIALARIEVLITRYKAAVLTLETCGSADRPRFPFVDLGDVTIDVSYGTSEKCSYERGNGIGVLRIPNIGSGRLDATDLKFAELSPKEIEKLTLKAGDLLIIRSNGSVGLVGRTALVEELHEGLLYAGYLIRIRINQTRLNPRFLNYYMASSEARKDIEAKAKSTSGVNNINSKQIAALKIPLPPLDEQTEIVTRIEAAFAQMETLSRAVTAARARLKLLDRAVLAKAFRGELVPQDTNDEPASELLKRLETQGNAHA